MYVSFLLAENLLAKIIFYFVRLGLLTLEDTGSDPRAGTGPSKLTHNEILRSVSLYYLTQTFTSSLYIYSQNPNGFGSDYRKAQTNAPLLFSAFKYNVAFWPERLVERVGNLVYYKSKLSNRRLRCDFVPNANFLDHDFGGHFGAVDNPPALLADLREIGTYWGF